MNGKINKIFDKLFHDMAIAELQYAYSGNNNGELSYHDVLYLNIIDAHPNEYTSSQIADLLGVTRPSVTQKINELCKKGYVLRTQSEKDKRVYYLSTNTEASDYFDETKKIILATEELLIKKYGKEKMNLFYEILEDFSIFSTDKVQTGGRNG